PGPLIILLHPSGFFIPSSSKLLPFLRGLARTFNATLVQPSYRLAPEHPFPTGINDAWTALKYCSQHLSDLNVDPAKGVVLGGISSGSNFAVALARRAVEENLPLKVTGVWASLYIGFGYAQDNQVGLGVPKEYPGLCTSRGQNRDALVISHQKAIDMFANYQPDFRSSLFNVFAQNPSFDLSAFPKTYIQAAGADYFRDDSVILAHALVAVDVPVRLDLYAGMPHSFFLWAVDMAQSRKAFRDVIMGFAWLLDVNVERLEEGWESVLVNMGCSVDLKKAAERMMAGK
ncbi:Alpha/Beta hydrolase protein, partial [Phaeosphaeriaceae sp. PMI808]